MTRPCSRRPAAQRHAGRTLHGDCVVGPSSADTESMGMNPFRPHRRSPADFVIVAAAFIVVVGLVAWAIYG
jgi:hypothetical protein